MTITATSAADRRAAIEALMDAEGGRIHGLALRLCGDAEDAADLVQETFFSAWRGWDGFEGRAQAGTWLYAIATRACRRMRRRRSGAPSAPLRAALQARFQRLPARPRRRLAARGAATASPIGIVIAQDLP